MTTIDLDEAERTHGNATVGSEWTAEGDTVYAPGRVIVCEATTPDRARAIAHARAFVPLAVARIRELEAALGGLLDDEPRERARAALRGGR